MEENFFRQFAQKNGGIPPPRAPHFVENVEREFFPPKFFLQKLAVYKLFWVFYYIFQNIVPGQAFIFGYLWRFMASAAYS